MFPSRFGNPGNWNTVLMAHEQIRLQRLVFPLPFEKDTIGVNRSKFELLVPAMICSSVPQAKANQLNLVLYCTILYSHKQKTPLQIPMKIRKNIPSHLTSSPSPYHQNSQLGSARLPASSSSYLTDGLGS